MRWFTTVPIFIGIIMQGIVLYGLAAGKDDTWELTAMGFFLILLGTQLFQCDTLIKLEEMIAKGESDDTK